MKVLVVKLTSMGDAIHLLPALSDLQNHIADISVDWMIEESFTEVPNWHNSIFRTIPIATRRWRSFKLRNLKEFITFWRNLRSKRYDVVIDAQGLIKSAVFARMAKINQHGRRIGFSAASIKEKPAAKLYRERIYVNRQYHAVKRLRILFARAFDYTYDDCLPNYQQEHHVKHEQKTILFLHGTTWASKHLPEQHWHDLLALATRAGYQVLLPWGNQREHERALRLAVGEKQARVLPKSSLSQLKTVFKTCSGAIAVDTGLGHLAAAIGLPTVSIYGATDAQLTGTVGANQARLQADFRCSPCLLKNCDKLTNSSRTPPCYKHIKVDQIWSAFTKLVI